MISSGTAATRARKKFFHNSAWMRERWRPGNPGNTPIVLVLHILGYDRVVGAQHTSMPSRKIFCGSFVFLTGEVAGQS